MNSPPSRHAIMLRSRIFHAWRRLSCMQPIFLKRLVGRSGPLSAPICFSYRNSNTVIIFTANILSRRWWSRRYGAFSKFGWGICSNIHFVGGMPIAIPMVWMWRGYLTAQGSILLSRMRRCGWLIARRSFYKGKTTSCEIWGGNKKAFKTSKQLKQDNAWYKRSYT
jgi:hypothetical protein